MATQIELGGGTPNGVLINNEASSGPVQVDHRSLGEDPSSSSVPPPPPSSSTTNTTTTPTSSTTTTATPSPFAAAALLQSVMSVLSSSPLTSRLSRSAEAEHMRTQAFSIWRSTKPWAEFGNTSKMNMPVSASEVQQRLSDNLTYFASNYALCFITLSCFGVLVHPVAFFCIVALAALYFALFMQQPQGMMIAPLRGPHRHNARVMTFVGVTFVTLYVTDAVGIIGSWMVLAGVMSVAHAMCRVSAKEPDFESPVAGAV